MSPCHRQGVATGYPQASQGRKKFTISLMKSFLKQGEGKEVSPLWKLLGGQPSLKVIITSKFCLPPLRLTFLLGPNLVSTGALTTLLTPLRAPSQSPTHPMISTVPTPGTKCSSWFSTTSNPDCVQLKASLQAKFPPICQVFSVQDENICS